jgi:dTDP-4-amino-4,6-dideoxygalactose transaminase
MTSRLAALQAAIIRVKLRHLNAWTKCRQKNAAIYDRLFADAGAADSSVPLLQGGFPLRTPKAPDSPARHIYNQYVIRVPADWRDSLRAHLTERNIGNKVYYPLSLHQQECFAYLGGKAGDLPESEAAAQETIALPVYPELSEMQIQYVVETITAFISAQTSSARR